MITRWEAMQNVYAMIEQRFVAGSRVCSVCIGNTLIFTWNCDL